MGHVTVTMPIREYFVTLRQTFLYPTCTQNFTTLALAVLQK